MDVEWEVLLPEVPDLELPAPTAARVEKKVIEPAGQCFQKGISEMLEAVIIPDSEYNKAVIVMESIKNVTAGLLENGGSPHVHMFRNWYLQLKNSVNNVLLIHISLENEGKEGVSLLALLSYGILLLLLLTITLSGLGLTMCTTNFK